MKIDIRHLKDFDECYNRHFLISLIDDNNNVIKAIVKKGNADIILAGSWEVASEYLLKNDKNLFDEMLKRNSIDCYLNGKKESI